MINNGNSEDASFIPDINGHISLFYNYYDTSGCFEINVYQVKLYLVNLIFQELFFKTIIKCYHVTQGYYLILLFWVLNKIIDRFREKFYFILLILPSGSKIFLYLMSSEILNSFLHTSSFIFLKSTCSDLKFLLVLWMDSFKIIIYIWDL